MIDYLEQKNAVSQIVSAYRGRVSLRAFAEAISVSEKVSYQSVKNWVDGRYLPDEEFIENLSFYGGWQGDFALDILAVLEGSREPATEVGREAINGI